ncbi:MAG TPA: glycoside hydrolase family 2 TIM barrel-domain containing protein [Thermoleophilaceae bacterium]|nr:glycoside hydrolase family 2 TIM barrel-domain containing protein [Thermoleophilaceae bacterium]
MTPASAAPPRPIELRSGWEVLEGDWRPTAVPSTFEGLARAPFYGGTLKLYRLRFTAPDVEGYDWAFDFEQVRRRATVSLNGRRIGLSIDPYTPFRVPARGLLPGEVNTLEVLVDSRKDPRLPEGWWNWGGIVRPVKMVPIGPAHVRDLALLPSVRCSGPATDCSASLLIDGILEKLPRQPPPSEVVDGRRVVLPPPRPLLKIRLEAPDGEVTFHRAWLRGSSAGRRRQKIQIAMPPPQLWSPELPQLYDARVTLKYDGEVTQVEKRKLGFRSIEVRDGMLLLNNRPINLRGASIHEDAPGRGAAINGYDMDTTVRELKELGANVTRAHYVLSQGLLNRFDKAGILVYNQAPVWQRDHGANLLRRPIDRARAVAQVERTVLAARGHPSVIVHSVANELTFTPDRRPASRRFLLDAAKAARDLDPLVPIAVDIKTRPWLPRQRTYDAFDLIGINQYFGWYPWVEDFAGLEPFLNRMRAYYPEQALVMTEFGAEGRPDMAGDPIDVKGSYEFQANHVARTIDLVDRLPFMSGAIHWTLREFEIFPDWRGGASGHEGPNDNIRHHKGVLTYTGERKPAWQVLYDRFVRTPFYR